MSSRRFTISALLCIISLALASTGTIAAALPSMGEKGARRPRFTSPIKELKGVFEKERQGVFLPYKDFQRLWRAAQDKPSAVADAPFDYLVSTARFHGNVRGEIAVLRLELTIDVLKDGWVQVPVGLSDVAVSGATLLDAESKKIVPLLRVVDGQYILVTKGKGRYALALDFVRQLETQPGLSIIVAGEGVTSIIVWGLIIGAGALMLRLGGFHRVLIILGAILVGGIARLFLPLLIDQVLRTGIFAAILVPLLWLAQWGFPRFPELRQRWTAGRQKALEARQKKKAWKEPTAKSDSVGDEEKEQDKQSEQDRE